METRRPRLAGDMLEQKQCRCWSWHLVQQQPHKTAEDVADQASVSYRSQEVSPASHRSRQATSTKAVIGFSPPRADRRLFIPSQCSARDLRLFQRRNIQYSSVRQRYFAARFNSSGESADENSVPVKSIPSSLLTVASMASIWRRPGNITETLHSVRMYCE